MKEVSLRVRHPEQPAPKEIQVEMQQNSGTS